MDWETAAENLIMQRMHKKLSLVVAQAAPLSQTDLWPFNTLDAMLIGGVKEIQN